MLNNKAKRNIWLALVVLSVGCIIDRVLRVIDGSVEWWNLLSVTIITVLCVRFYLCYHKQVKHGNISGRVKVFK